MRRRPSEFKIKNWSSLSKDMLYRKAFQRGVSLNEMIKIVIRDYLHREFPNQEVE